VSKQLKDSTRTLCRVLKDNPDVQGNQQKIKRDKNELTHCCEKLLFELKDLGYGNFKQFINDELEKQGELERLRDTEKQYN
jgi:hypothetical protein